METLALGLVGLLLIGLVTVDILWTTLSLKGGGPITSWLTRVLAKRLFGRNPVRYAQRIAVGRGPAILLAIILVWIVLMWTGWVLLFSASEGSIVSAQDGAPANAVTRIYFVGYTLFTLGLGDYHPVDPFWQLATAVMSASGFIAVTLVISYLVPLLNAAVELRQIAFYVFSLGDTPHTILLRSWNGTDFDGLNSHLVALTAMLADLGERHLAYPVLRHFDSNNQGTTIALAIAILDEALTMLQHGVRSDIRPSPIILLPLRQAVSEYIETIKPFLVESAEELPGIPALSLLASNGIPTTSEESFELALQGLQERRTRLLSLVHSSGWEWDAIVLREPDMASLEDEEVRVA